MLGAVDAVDAKSRVSVDAADLLMVSSLASTKRVEHGSFAAGPPPSPVHGASQAMLIDDRPGWASDLCSTDGHVLLRKRGARYKMCSTAQPACHVLEGSMCHSSYEGPWSGSSRSVHAGSPGNRLNGQGSAVNTM